MRKQALLLGVVVFLFSFSLVSYADEHAPIRSENCEHQKGAV